MNVVTARCADVSEGAAPAHRLLRWRLESRSTSTGVMLQTYRPAGRATFGRADE